MPRNSLRTCVWTYKGGAAKTTIVVNAAAALAHPKHGGKLKTLLIDLDPQCNSTQFYHDDNESGGGGRTVQKEETEATADNGAANALLHARHGVEPKLISDSLHPDCEAASMDALVSSGQSPLYQFMKLLFVEQDASKIRALIEEQGFELLHKVNVDEHTKTSEFGDNFWVLEGDPHIAEFEVQIANAFRDFTQKAMIKHIGLISYLMEMYPRRQEEEGGRAGRPDRLRRRRPRLRGRGQGDEGAVRRARRVARPPPQGEARRRRSGGGSRGRPRLDEPPRSCSSQQGAREGHQEGQGEGERGPVALVVRRERRTGDDKEA